MFMQTIGDNLYQIFPKHDFYLNLIEFKLCN